MRDLNEFWKSAKIMVLANGMQGGMMIQIKNEQGDWEMVGYLQRLEFDLEGIKATFMNPEYIQNPEGKEATLHNVERLRAIGVLVDFIKPEVVGTIPVGSGEFD
jgi:hypothetical protein